MTRCEGVNGKSPRTLTHTTSAHASAAASAVLVIACISRHVTRSVADVTAAGSRCVIPPGAERALRTLGVSAAAFWPTADAVSATHSRVAPNRNERASSFAKPAPTSPPELGPSRTRSLRQAALGSGDSLGEG
jgi:hypothetical protein